MTDKRVGDGVVGGAICWGKKRKPRSGVVAVDGESVDQILARLAGLVAATVVVSMAAGRVEVLVGT
jgi:hypothetical protein